MRLVHVVCVGLLVAATPAVAGGEASQSAEAKDQVICKRTRVTGSLAQTKKVCGTKQFWEERTRRGKEWSRDVQEQGRKQPIEGT